MTVLSDLRVGKSKSRLWSIDMLAGLSQVPATCVRRVGLAIALGHQIQSSVKFQLAAIRQRWETLWETYLRADDVPLVLLPVLNGLSERLHIFVLPGAELLT